jgi:phosphoserine phosphatase
MTRAFLGYPLLCWCQLLAIDVTSTLIDMEEVADGAEKELAIETKLSEMEDKWKNERFRFVEWRGRGVHVFVGIAVILEELEEVRLCFFFAYVVHFFS